MGIENIKDPNSYERLIPLFQHRKNQLSYKRYQQFGLGFLSINLLIFGGSLHQPWARQSSTMVSTLMSSSHGFAPRNTTSLPVRSICSSTTSTRTVCNVFRRSSTTSVNIITYYITKAFLPWYPRIAPRSSTCSASPGLCTQRGGCNSQGQG